MGFCEKFGFKALNFVKSPLWKNQKKNPDVFNYLVEASMNMSNECLCLCVLKNVLWVKLKNCRGGGTFF